MGASLATRLLADGLAVADVPAKLAARVRTLSSGHGRKTDAADFQGEEDVDPFQGDRAVDVEEVHGEHGRGLRAQEPSP